MRKANKATETPMTYFMVNRGIGERLKIKMYLNTRLPSPLILGYMHLSVVVSVMKLCYSVYFVLSDAKGHWMRLRLRM